MSAAERSPLRPARRIAFTMLMIGIAAGIILVLGELLVRFVAPQPYMIPRYQYSQRFGLTLPAGRSLIHRKPGHWEFKYSINKFGYRGDPVPIKLKYKKPAIVVLGDSNTMGIGVNDGEEYPAVLSRKLEGRFNVINLGVGGYGLTQAIRYYAEFGRLYEPSIVIVQFSRNDVTDNLFHPVAKVSRQQIEFQLTDKAWGPLKQLLADSVIQRSQLYNFFRDRAFQIIRRKETQQPGTESQEGKNRGQRFYSELLEVFARHLSEQNISVVFIAVNGALERFPLIQRKVELLSQENSLRYVEVQDWFEGVSDFSSPEGHTWGKKGHEIVGHNLARVIAEIDP